MLVKCQDKAAKYGIEMEGWGVCWGGRSSDTDFATFWCSAPYQPFRWWDPENFAHPCGKGSSTCRPHRTHLQGTTALCWGFSSYPEEETADLSQDRACDKQTPWPSALTTTPPKPVGATVGWGGTVDRQPGRAEILTRCDVMINPWSEKKGFRVLPYSALT